MRRRGLQRILGEYAEVRPSPNCCKIILTRVLELVH